MACGAVVYGCGGQVVFVEDDGDDPQGGAPSTLGGAPSEGGGPPQVTGGASAGGSTNVGVPVTECQAACNTIFQCALQSDDNGLLLCPGIEPGDQSLFVPGCADTCEQQMGLLAIVDPDDCQGTIETLQTLNAEFDQVCEFGF